MSRQYMMGDGEQPSHEIEELLSEIDEGGAFSLLNIVKDLTSPAVALTKILVDVEKAQQPNLSSDHVIQLFEKSMSAVSRGATQLVKDFIALPETFDDI